MELTANPHMLSILEAADTIATARKIVCHARDEEFAPTEFPMVPIYFRRMADARKVVDCLNEHFWGSHASALVICIYH